MPRCTSNGTDSLAAFSTPTTTASSATVAAYGRSNEPSSERASRRRDIDSSMGRSSSSFVTARPRQSVVVKRSPPFRLGCAEVAVAVELARRALGRALPVHVVETAAVLVLLPVAAALDVLVEVVVGRQQIAVFRCIGKQLRVRADPRD